MDAFVLFTSSLVFVFTHHFLLSYYCFEAMNYRIEIIAKTTALKLFFVWLLLVKGVLVQGLDHPNGEEKGTFEPFKNYEKNPFQSTLDKIVNVEMRALELGKTMEEIRLEDERLDRDLLSAFEGQVWILLATVGVLYFIKVSMGRALIFVTNYCYPSYLAIMIRVRCQII